MNDRMPILLATASLSFIGACPLLAQAQADDTGPSTIVVTAAQINTEVKGNTPVLTTPQNIQVLSERLLHDEQATLLDDALRNVAGVQPGTVAVGFDEFRIRGFDASDYIYVDGLQRETTANIEVTGIDRVEVLKGPSSSLFGQGAPGGLVNIISKHPTPTPFANFEMTVGSYGSWRPTLDVDAPLDSAGTIYARLYATYRHDGSFVDSVAPIRRLFLAPSITFELSSNTTLTILSQYQNETHEDVAGLPAPGTVLSNPNGPIAYDRFVGSTSDPSFVRNINSNIGYQFRHQFSPDLNFYQNFRAAWYRPEWRNLWNGDHLDDDQRTLYLYVFNYHERLAKQSSDTGINWDVATGPVQHHVSAGVEYSHLNETYTYDLNFDDLLPLDLYTPNYAFGPPTLTASPDEVHSGNLGLYVQDQLKLDSRLTLTVGGRWTRVSTTDAGQSTLDSAFTPRIGATYEAAPGVFLYSSWSRSFNPQPGYLTAAGVEVDPETGTQWEAGVKLALLDERLNSTAAVYQLTRSKVATQNPTDPASYVVTGRQRSRGIELDNQFRISKGWDLVAAYAYTHAVVIQDTTIPVGDWTLNVPRHTLNLWMKYVIPVGPLQNFGIGAGGTYNSRQAGDVPNTFFLPAYALANFNFSYEHAGWSAQLNLNNAFDKHYFPTSYNEALVMRGTPRTVWFNVGRAF